MGGKITQPRGRQERPAPHAGEWPARARVAFRRRPIRAPSIRPEEAPIARRTVKELRSKDTWTIFRIMAEFVEGFETLGPIWPAVSVFGGARAARDSETYRMGREIGNCL